MLTYELGNLLDNMTSMRFKNTAHGCNTCNTMGGGVAKFISRQFPQALEVDRSLWKYYNAHLLQPGRHTPTPNMLGNYSMAKLGNIDSSYQSLLFNLYTQVTPAKSTTERAVNYEAVTEAYISMMLYVTNNGQTNGLNDVNLPLIGCGLANGDWKVIHGILEAYTPEDVDTVVTVLPQIKEIEILFGRDVLRNAMYIDNMTIGVAIEHEGLYYMGVITAKDDGSVKIELVTPEINSARPEFIFGQLGKLPIASIQTKYIFRIH